MPDTNGRLHVAEIDSTLFFCDWHFARTNTQHVGDELLAHPLRKSLSPSDVNLNRTLAKLHHSILKILVTVKCYFAKKHESALASFRL